MSFFTLKNGMKLYYEDMGRGDPVVMMHGWSSSHKIYSKTFPYLSQFGRCIIYDHRGHGKSISANRVPATMETLASDLNEIMHGLSLENVTLVGWSMGAGTVMTYIRDYGTSRLKQAVLCDMSPKVLNDDQWKLGLYQGNYTAADMKKDCALSSYAQYRKFLLGTIPKLKKLPPWLLWMILKKQLRQCDERLLISLSDSMRMQDHRSLISKIDIPLTYFYADPGSLFSPALAEWYQQNASVPVRTVRFPECTHMLIAEQPVLFAMEMQKLLEHPAGQ